jgi:hypothetical protein
MEMTDDEYRWHLEALAARHVVPPRSASGTAGASSSRPVDAIQPLRELMLPRHCDDTPEHTGFTSA